MPLSPLLGNKNGTYDVRWTREHGAWQARVIRQWVGEVQISSLRKRRLPPEPLVPVPETFISVGQPSDFNVNDFRNRGIVFIVKPKENVEVSREVSIKRVENPDDPNQFVDIERMDRVSFKQPGKAEELKLKFNNPE